MQEIWYLEHAHKNSDNWRPQADDQEDAGNDERYRNGRGQTERMPEEHPDFMVNHRQSD